jgi:hypothetical protein
MSIFEGLCSVLFAVSRRQAGVDSPWGCRMQEFEPANLEQYIDRSMHRAPYGTIGSRSVRAWRGSTGELVADLNIAANSAHGQRS